VGALTDGKYKLRDVIENLDHEELIKMKKDIDAGGLHMKKFLQQKIKENEHKHDQYCVVCVSKIDPYKTSNYTLVFGPSDFKKKATFCALDCLKYFLQNLEQIKKQGSYNQVKNPNI